MFCQSVDWVCDRKTSGDFTFDSYFTNAESLNYIYAKKDKFDRPHSYVGDLKFNRKIQWKGKELKAEKFAAATSGNGTSPVRFAYPTCES